ncbi:Threonine/homoserine/homoserine lactone efflux protein [Kaistia soli DSM 19436]|uniref:Threonine/homoserine/homoserine lactone efflux protein n=1 Tax=Kaistia soli DSM 19436 TaxID=1122133 RepID=A0A1M5NKG4_9HYPH|nr:LysE family transporter [Kaistia soli]SHG90076.1 Threonine/homoserine/homoserine lactone efflux protein [Kaistia soli DSM 19436]
MTDPFAFALAVFALLAVPGPTNTLLAASGASVGFRRSLRIIPAEIGGYAIAIAFLLAVFGPLASAHPALTVASRLVASLYLAWSALTLWRGAATAGRGVHGAITVRRVFVTTLLNPKALLFAFVIFPPPGDPHLALQAPLFAGLMIGIASCWIGFGRLLARSASGIATPARISQGAAVAMSIFAVLIGSSAIAAVLA